MRRLCSRMLMFAVAVFGQSVWADNPIECVDPDIVNTLLGMPGQGQVEISRALPASFPTVMVPTDFELIGSRRSSYFTMVSFKTSSSVDDTHARLRRLMMKAEWQVPEINVQGIQGGFQSTQTSQIRSALSMCHDEMGSLTAMFAIAPHDGTYITFMAAPQGSVSQCTMMQPGMAVALQRPSMPSLNLPKEAKSISFGGISGSGDQASTRIQLETSLAASELLTFFNQQLTEQNWMQEGAWIGLKMSGSAWLSNDEKQSGLLSVFDQGNSKFKLTFQTTGDTTVGSRANVSGLR